MYVVFGILILIVGGGFAAMIYGIVIAAKVDREGSFPMPKSFLDDFSDSASNSSYSSSSYKESSFYNDLDRGEYDDDPDILMEEDPDTYYEDY